MKNKKAPNWNVAELDTLIPYARRIARGEITYHRALNLLDALRKTALLLGQPMPANFRTRTREAMRKQLRTMVTDLKAMKKMANKAKLFLVPHIGKPKLLGEVTNLRARPTR